MCSYFRNYPLAHLCLFSAVQFSPLFQMYRTKTREKTGPLITNTGELVENYENMSTLLDNYFLSVYAKEDRTTIPERVQVYEGGVGDELRDIIITSQVVQDEIDKLKKNKSHGPDGIFPRALHECK